MDVKDSFFIFDEQRVVGSGAWAKSFLKITKENDWILLSATPGDCWNDYIPVFIANGFFKNRTEFIQEHVVYSRFSKYPKIDRYVNTGRLIRLRNKVLVTMEYKKHTTPHHEDVWVEYNQYLYKNIFKDRWNNTKNCPIKNASELCYELRKTVNSDPSRLIAVLEILETKNKVIIFYNFNYELDLLKDLAYNAAIEVAEWNGQKHQPIPDSDSWIYLVQYNAGDRKSTRLNSSH